MKGEINKRWTGRSMSLKEIHPFSAYFVRTKKNTIRIVSKEIATDPSYKIEIIVSIKELCDFFFTKKNNTLSLFAKKYGIKEAVIQKTINVILSNSFIKNYYMNKNSNQNV